MVPPFKKPSKWLHNKPWMLGLEQSCRCSSSADHFVIEGTFTHASVADFAARCRPSPDEVYGRWPKVGEHVSAFSASYPKLLCARIASGAIAARHDSAPIVPIAAKVLSFRRIGIRPDLPRNLYPTFRQQIPDLFMRILNGSKNLRIPCRLKSC